MSKNLLGSILTPLKLLTKYSLYGCKAGFEFRGWLYRENASALPTNTVQLLNASWQFMFLTGCGAVVSGTLPSKADLAEAEVVICWCWQSLSHLQTLFQHSFFCWNKPLELLPKVLYLRQVIFPPSFFSFFFFFCFKSLKAVVCVRAALSRGESSSSSCGATEPALE